MILSRPIENRNETKEDHGSKARHVEDRRGLESGSEKLADEKASRCRLAESAEIIMERKPEKPTQIYGFALSH